MKKLLLIAVIMMSLSSVTMAAEKQTQKAEDVKGAIVINKQPTQDKATQEQQATKIYGSIVILVQGKVPFDKTDNK